MARAGAPGLPAEGRHRFRARRTGREGGLSPGASGGGSDGDARVVRSGVVDGGPLGVSVSALLEGPAEGRVRVVDADGVAPLWSGEEGGEARLVLTASGPAPVEVWRWRLEPGEQYPSHPHQAGVVETVSVTSGRTTLVVDGVEHPVGTGQTAAFDGDTPHAHRGAGTCHLIMTVHLPPGPASTP
ncbi:MULTISPECIES: cupin domain-containing protein [unclassified Streptomyces]|uniref:cupin domain-containing protein n=1 Tax=unclassified Streptomyces TaxID=2593676 RepID=UPI00380831A6